MEKRNTILLTVIAIATLLVAVVGATFAYFTATTQADDIAGSSANLKTNTINGANFTFSNAGAVLNLLDYPGGLGIYGATAKIEKQQSSDENNYSATFDLQIKYTNTTQTDLDWELWMIDKEIKNLDFSDEGGFDHITTCELKKKVDGLNTHYWYADETDGNEDYTVGRCDAENIKTAVKTAGGTMIAYGKLAKNENADQMITKDTANGSLITFGDSDPNSITANQLGARTLNTVDPSTKVYYLVVKYPNSGLQNSDQGQDIKVTLEAVNPTSVLYTAS